MVVHLILKSRAYGVRRWGAGAKKILACVKDVNPPTQCFKLTCYHREDHRLTTVYLVKVWNYKLLIEGCNFKLRMFFGVPLCEIQMGQSKNRKHQILKTAEVCNRHWGFLKDSFWKGYRISTNLVPFESLAAAEHYGTYHTPLRFGVPPWKFAILA